MRIPAELPDGLYSRSHRWWILYRPGATRLPVGAGSRSVVVTTVMMPSRWVSSSSSLVERAYPRGHSCDCSRSLVRAFVWLPVPGRGAPRRANRVTRRTQRMDRGEACCLVTYHSVAEI